MRIEAKEKRISKSANIEDCILLTSGTLEIGENVQIKEGVVINAFKGIKIGDDTIIDRRVIVGGLQSQHSYFEVGSRCVILHESYINTTREVIIGDNVGIGGRCMLFTHGTWQNIFRGYPVDFGEIVIEDDAWLPWHVTVLPNVVIGKGATLGAGALVTKDIPPFSLAVGAPAKVIKIEGYPKKQTIEEKDSIARALIQDFVGYLCDFKGEKVYASEEGEKIVIVDETRGMRLYYYKSIKPETLKGLTVASFKIPKSVEKQNEWIDLEHELMSISKDNWLAQEFVNFARRYGVRPVLKSP
jgi:acetyltransferase-like isoleucine patch superfamily enzyme